MEEINNNMNNESSRPVVKKRMKWWLKVIIIVGIVIIVGSILGLFNSNRNSPLDIVKGGTFNAYPDVEIGKAFNYFFSDPRWKSFKTDENEQIVEFKGGATLDDQPVTVEMQFEVKNNSFEVFWLGVDGEDQSNDELLDWIDTVCSEYQNRKSN